MRYLSAFVMGAAFIFAVLVIFPWMKSNLEFMPQIHIEGGNGERSTSGSSSGRSQAESSNASKHQDATRAEIEEELAIAAERSKALNEQEHGFQKTVAAIEIERRQIDSLKDQIETDLIDKLGQRALSDGSIKSRRQQTAIAKASPDERRRLMIEAYQQMTAEGLAEVVQDLAKEERTDSAVSVLSVLEDRKVARVLALVASPKPELAATLTAQLQGSSLRLRQ